MKTLALAAWLGLVAATWAYQNLESPLRTNGAETVEAFEPVRAVLQESSAVILDGRDQLVYGVVVSPDGLLLTKASEIDGHSKISVRVGDRFFEKAEVLSVDPAWDLALIKIKATGLTPVRWARGSDLPQGSWVVSNGATSRSRRRALVGIISANSREISGAPSVILGVTLGVDGKGLSVEKVAEESGAAEAGLKEGDVLVSFDEVELEGREQLLELLKTKRAGDSVSFAYEREGKLQNGEIVLKARNDLIEEELTRNDHMSGRISERRTSFKRVIQHDVPGNSESVGGPLLNLDGECVGMNIAYANRAESFAIPVEELQEILERLNARASH